jgi:hypothetical protein
MKAALIPFLGVHDGLDKLRSHSKSATSRLPKSEHPVRFPFFNLRRWYLTNLPSAGGSVTVTIPVLSSQLAVWTVQNSWAVESGKFNIKVGTSDQVFAQTNLTVS